jgi:hypothetical protein
LNFQSYLFQNKISIEAGKRAHLSALKTHYAGSPLSFQSAELFLKHSRGKINETKYNEFLDFFKQWNPNSKLIQHLFKSEEGVQHAA